MFSSAIVHGGRDISALRATLPDAAIVADDGAGIASVLNRRGCWPLARRAWQGYTWRSHHLVLEDDAVLCSRFIVLVSDAILRAPDACISLFRGVRHCSVATVMPASVVQRWLTWTAQQRFQLHHDHMIDDGMIALGVRHLHTEPSLVEHTGVSLLDHPPNRALRFDPAVQEFTLAP